MLAPASPVTCSRWLPTSACSLVLWLQLVWSVWSDSGPSNPASLCSTQSSPTAWSERSCEPDGNRAQPISHADTCFDCPPLWLLTNGPWGSYFRSRAKILVMLSAAERRQRWKMSNMEQVPLPQTSLRTLAQETWAKIYSGIESLEGATFEAFRAICGEEQDLVSKQCTEEPSQVSHVAHVAGPVATVFILHLPGERKSGGQLWGGEIKDTGTSFP